MAKAPDRATAMPDVDQRRAAFGLDQAFEDALAATWRLVEPAIQQIARSLLEQQAAYTGAQVSDRIVAQRVRYARGKLSEPIDQAWIDRIGDRAAEIFEQGSGFYAVSAGMLAAQRRIHDLIFESLSDPAELRRLTWATQKLAVIETEIMITRMQQLTEARSREALARQAEMFRERVGEAIAHAAGVTCEAGDRSERMTAQSSDMVRLAKEGAAAAAQAAASVEGTAPIVAGLVDAMSVCRTEAEASALAGDDARRESGNAQQAALELATLVKQIGAIVEIIGGIAQQTRLISLNASIEASRAGEHGAGFGIVANEVKALAQRATASTGEIGERMQSVQNSVRRVVATSSELHTVLDRLAVSTSMIRQVIDEQTQTVTAIAGAVDESALVARQVSDLVDEARRSVEAVRGEAEWVSGSVAAVNAELTAVQDALTTFLEEARPAASSKTPSCRLERPHLDDRLGRSQRHSIT